jgi:hypothetical protein
MNARHDARLAMQRAEAFITEILMDVSSLPGATKEHEEKKLIIIYEMARKARTHLGQAMGILGTIPESFIEAEKFVSNGEPYKPEDIFGQD